MSTEVLCQMKKLILFKIFVLALWVEHSPRSLRVLVRYQSSPAQYMSSKVRVSFVGFPTNMKKETDLRTLKEIKSDSSTFSSLLEITLIFFFHLFLQDSYENSI